MENGTTFTVKPTKESRFHKVLEGAFYIFYHDGVMCKSRICRAIGIRLGLLLNFVEEWPLCWQSLKRSQRGMKKALQTFTKEDWEEARENKERWLGV